MKGASIAGQRREGHQTPDSPVMAGSISGGSPADGLTGIDTPVDHGNRLGSAAELQRHAEALREELHHMAEAQELPPLEEPASSSSAPPPEQDKKTQGSTETQAQISLGTVGHPVSCGQACRYVKRKGGCREGAACLCCHLCFWVRHKDEQPPARRNQANQRRPISSMGTVGHPVSCGDACSLAWTEGGCPAGSACQKCHRCTPEPLPEVVTYQGRFHPHHRRLLEPGAAGADVTQPAIAFSVGSFGHPFSCAEPCKYAHKPRGCKDGQSCSRCHFCSWHRHAPPTQLPCTRWEGVIHESL